MLLEGRRVIERAARWLLRKRRRPLDIAETVAYFGPGAAELYETLPELLAADDAEPILRRAESFEHAGVPGPLARRVAGLSTMFATLDIVEIADEADALLADVARVHFQLGSQLYLHWLRDRAVELPRDDRWKALARAALRDDLNGIHRDLTAAVLRDAGSVGDAEAHVRRWIETNPAGERYMQTLSDVRVGRVYDLTTLPVAVREARNLLH
jgi:glutamate dehydrogenase